MTSSRRSLRLFVAVSLGLASSTRPAFALPEWIGGSGTSNNWTDHLNWVVGDRPGSDGKDSVHFYGNPARKTANVNSDYWIKDLFFMNDVGGESSFTINGDHTLKLADGVYNTSSKSQTINVALQFTSDGDLSNNSYGGGYGWMGFGGSIDTAGHTITIQPSTNNLSLNGSFTGSGKLIINGPGWATFGATNSYSGGLEIRKGYASVNSGPQLGALGNQITFNQTDSSYVPTLYRSGTGTTSGPILFNAGEGRFEVPGGVTETLTGVMGGSGTLGKTGTGTLILDGASGYNGTTGHTGPVHVYAGTLSVVGATRLPTNRITVDAGATLSYGANLVDLIGSLSGAGTVQFGSGSGFNIGVPGDINTSRDGSGTFSGLISGINVSLTKQGIGTLSLTGGNSYTGTTKVFNGILSADNAASGTSATGTSSVVVFGLGTLAGGGTILGPVTLQSGGWITPSNIGFPGSFMGTLTVGSLAITDADATVSIDLSVGGANDKLNVLNNASLGGTLSLTRVLGIDLTGNTPREILHANGALTGTFATVNGVVQANDTGLAVTYAAHGVFVTVARRGDATLDGSVKFDDLLILAKNYNSTGKTWASGDFNGDGAVGFNDLLTLAKNYNTTAPAAGLASLDATLQADWALAQSLVPEPTILAAGVSLCAAGTIRRRGPLAATRNQD